jgi:exodeoxyribonuclease-3
MKLVTWNVNSLNVRGPLVEEFLDEVSPDVLCLQELKLPADRVPTDIFERRGYHVALHAQPRWNGVLIASKAPMTDVVTGFSGEEEQARMISASIGGIRIVDLYCPQGSSADSPKFAYKLRFFDALVAWLAERDPTEPLILTGDINIAPNPDDVWSVQAFDGVPTYHPQEHLRWNAMLGWGLTDALRPHLAANSYTFWDYRGGAFWKNRGMRIDHFLVTEPVRQRVVGGQVHRDWRKQRGEVKASDHAPVELLLS